jgi:predicted CopG family antitoxin
MSAKKFEKYKMIIVHKETWEKLRNMKNHPRETMEDVIKRLIENYEIMA